MNAFDRRISILWYKVPEIDLVILDTRTRQKSKATIERFSDDLEMKTQEQNKQQMNGNKAI